MKKRILMMALLLISSMALTSCKTTSVYVLDQAELVKVKKGDKVEAKFDGWVLSNRAVNRVMNAKVDDINRD